MSIHLSVVIACYDEEAALPRLFREVRRLEALAEGRGLNLETVFVDDGSTDGTGKGLRDFTGGKELRRLVVHEKNRGFGAALRTGLDAARGGVLVSWDADATYPVKDILALYDRLGEADVAGASPFAAGGEARAKRLRLLLSRLVAAAYGLALRGAGRGITVYTSAFRAYRREALAGIRNRSDDFLAAAELLARLLLSGARVVEVPSRLSARVDGRSKMRVVRTALRHLAQIARIALRRPPFRPPPPRAPRRARQPAPANLRAWNEALNRTHPMRDIEGNQNPLIRWIEERRRRKVAGLLDARPGMTVLDVGAEEGAYATRLPRTVAVDIDSRVLAAGRARHARPSVAADAARLPFAGDSVPRVLLAETLEHCPDPAAVLAEAMRVLSPGGRVAVSVPDDRRLLLLKGMLRAAGLCHLLSGLPPGRAPGHLHVFGRDRLVDLLCSTGRVLSFERDPAALAFLAVLAPRGEDPPPCAASRASSGSTVSRLPPARS